MNITWPQKRLSNRQLAAIPLAIIAVLTISILVLSVPLSTDFRESGLIRVRGLKNVPDAGAVEIAVENLLHYNVDVNIVENGFDIGTSNVLGGNETLLVKSMFLSRFGIPENSVTVELRGATITSIYSEQAVRAMVGAFIAMGVIIFIAFRRRITVGAILLAVGLDLLGVFGCMALFGVELSLASVAGLLMLIGYAVDTNILLTTRVLKRVGGEPKEQVIGAMRTGLMMSGSTLIPLFAISLLTTAPQLYQLTAVLIFGIIIDIFNTWFLNAAIVMRHAERQRRKEYHVSI